MSLSVPLYFWRHTKQVGIWAVSFKKLLMNHVGFNQLINKSLQFVQICIGVNTIVLKKNTSFVEDVAWCYSQCHLLAQES